MLAIVAAETADDVLQREARSMDATYIVRPEREQDLAQAVVELVRSRPSPPSADRRPLTCGGPEVRYD